MTYRREDNGFTSFCESLKYFAVALLPILAQYEFIPLLNLGYAFLLLAIIIEALNKKTLSIDPILFFTLIGLSIFNLVVGYLKYTAFTNTINNSAGLFVFSLIAAMICSSSNLERAKLYRMCWLISVLSTFFIFLQFTAYYGFGIIIKGNFPGLIPLFEGTFEGITRGRPASVFFEPAHYAIYVLPVYAISLLEKKHFTSVFLLTGLFVSTSTTGILLAFLIPLFVLLRGKKMNSIVAISSFFVILMIFQEYATNYFFRKISIENLMNNERVFGTLRYFDYFSDIEKLFGIGLNRLEEFSVHRSFFARNYASSFFFALFSFGLVGLLVWISYIVSLFLRTDREYRVIFYVFLLISLSDQILFNRNLMYLLIWVYASSSVRKEVYSLPKEEMRPSYHERM